MKRIKEPYLFDGATGTYLQELSPLEEGTFEEYNITKPEIVKKLHEDYVEAGAMGLKTNTFGANTISLGDFHRVKEVITQGILLAKEVIPKDRDIFGSIGPIKLPEEEALQEYKKIIEIFLEEGIDHFLFETFSEGSLFPKISSFIKERAPEAYIITSFAVFPSGETALGISADELLKETEKDPNIDGIGFNCVSGPRHLTTLVKNLNLGEKPISLMPNAGYPTIHGGRTFFGDHPEYFAQELVQESPNKVKIFGGCCGTKPLYIKALRKALEKRAPHTFEKKDVEVKLGVERIANPFYKKLKDGGFPIVVEYDPPADLDIDKYMKNVKYLKELGVDAITLADCPVARARIDAGLMGVKIKRDEDMVPIVHMTCRDRNLNATKALLMGLAMEGIQNLLLVTGDPIPTAERDEIKAVFQMNSVRLAKYVSKLNDEVFPNPMSIGGALNINARNFSAELKKAVRKEEAGVEIFYTQPVLSRQGLENLKKARKELSSYIMGGMIPVVSARNARFMQSEISGITMDEEVLESFTDDMSREEAADLGVSWALKYMKESKNFVDGFYLITPFHRVEVIGAILSQMDF
ncbi:MAG: bifunctional homocysteine S-methyltransferase/methylenetetrahydrofolate reductase [Tissierellia bacterium]|nr:bifunctional homocysteine S-methyltransferase/methylenetetrahydrofolate reductase [Tissierellia bacterium]